jgi:hypothetical protein
MTFLANVIDDLDLRNAEVLHLYTQSSNVTSNI